jgi:hypothetical protein
MKRENALADYAGLDHAVERPDTPPPEDRGLATVAQVRKFLRELANTRHDWADIRRFSERHGRVLPGPIWGTTEIRDEHSGFWRTIPADRRFFVLQDVVQQAWREPDGWKRSYILLPILAPFIGHPHQPRSVIDQAFRYLIEHPDLTRVCPNDECPARYFFSPRPGQQYCSSECAKDAQRAHKRKWWAEHGAEWRQKHMKKSARKAARRRR